MAAPSRDGSGYEDEITPTRPRSLNGSFYGPVLALSHMEDPDFDWSVFDVPTSIARRRAHQHIPNLALSYRLTTRLALTSRQQLEARNDEGCAICLYPYDPKLTYKEGRTTRNGDGWGRYIRMRNMMLDGPRIPKVGERKQVSFCKSPPVSLSCGHNFGLFCILEAAKFVPHLHLMQCPVCRKVLAPIAPGVDVLRAYKHIYTAATLITPPLDLEDVLDGDKFLGLLQNLTADFAPYFSQVGPSLWLVYSSSLINYARGLEPPRRRYQIISKAIWRFLLRRRPWMVLFNFDDVSKQPQAVFESLMGNLPTIAKKKEVDVASWFFQLFLGRVIDEYYWNRSINIRIVE